MGGCAAEHSGVGRACVLAFCYRGVCSAGCSGVPMRCDAIDRVAA